MSEEKARNRDIQNYFPKELEIFERETKKTLIVYEILSSFLIFPGGIQLVFDGWTDATIFNGFGEPEKDMNVALGIEPDEAAEIRNQIENAVLAYLTTELKTNWRVEEFFIDMRLKKIRLSAVHKNFSDRKLIQKIDTESEFDELVANNQEMVGLIETFAWDIAQTSEFLARFE